MGSAAYANVTFDGNLFKIEFDPGRGVTAGQPSAITQGTRSTLFPDVSPNGEWVVAGSLRARARKTCS